MRHIYSMTIIAAVAAVAWPLAETWRFPLLFALLIVYAEVHKHFWPLQRDSHL